MESVESALMVKSVLLTPPMALLSVAPSPMLSPPPQQQRQRRPQPVRLPAAAWISSTRRRAGPTAPMWHISAPTPLTNKSCKMWVSAILAKNKSYLAMPQDLRFLWNWGKYWRNCLQGQIEPADWDVRLPQRGLPL